jgi:hypothetical protein
MLPIITNSKLIMPLLGVAIANDDDGDDGDDDDDGDGDDDDGATLLFIPSFASACLLHLNSGSLKHGEFHPENTM